MSKGKNLKVLVVDDHNSMVRIITNVLGQIGIKNVDTANDGGAALAKLQSAGDFDLILSDWNMEPVSGLQLLKEVRADENISKTAFIMVTAEKKGENVQAAIAAGVNNYVGKPFTADVIKQKIETTLGYKID